MQHLLQPRVLWLACLASLGSAVACYPCLALWPYRPSAIWYLEAVLFVCGITLWGFVFAWHRPYLHRPVFNFRPGLKFFGLATLAGLLAAAACQLWLDASIRAILPEEYPEDLHHWVASVLFSLALTQLFLIFAPYVWLMRLFKRRWVATSLTILFGTAVLALKLSSLPPPVPPVPPWLLGSMLASRLAFGCLAVFFFQRGGVLLVWWWVLLLETRHLLHFHA